MMREVVTLMHDDDESFYVELRRYVSSGDSIVVLTTASTPDAVPNRLLEALRIPWARPALTPLLDDAHHAFRPGTSTTLTTNTSFLCLAVGFVVGAFFGPSHMVVGLLSGAVLDFVIARLRRCRTIAVDVDVRGCLRFCMVSAGEGC